MFRIAGTITSILGVGCLLLSAYLPPQIGPDGILHEAFFLIGTGYFLLFIGIALFTAQWLTGGRKGGISS
ncbi:DUF3955 domain-containing protein [Ruegeria sp. HKCCD8929]|uniref:DUF3955 domain-containing protein n=1 Tax=Ruegeria sp. HKCCD8929 TaxID=2683006 RepID=UPI00148905CF|nr:DUF3955 domain-containing protein [Ruegeria sp. HKCCD8929]